ncbi:MAG: polymer-forming cytoskeletal protein [bacterium]|nr:polymer-forming cytoskeletal protein [bacterium]MCM1375126.1 polymer-forming cytoskeletal protein [Muribaculum sp.]
MGFFSDLKEDLSQAVNELMPEDTQPQKEGFGDINEMLDRVDSIVVSEVAEEEAAVEQSQAAVEEPVEGMELPEESVEAEAAEEALEEVTEELAEEAAGEPAGDNLEAELAAALDEEVGANATEPDMDLEKLLESALAANEVDVAPVYEEKQEPVKENVKEIKGETKVAELINARMASDETSSVTAGMTINGDVISEGSMDLIGCINGNIDILGKLNVTGYINGNSKAAEIYMDNAKINGEVVSEGAVKIGSSSVVIGNICATSAVIAGAVKGDIDVQGPVILDTSAIVMGNIKSKSVQINNGAVIEGMCSQCYADVNPISFFDDYKPEVKKGRK